MKKLIRKLIKIYNLLIRFFKQKLKYIVYIIILVVGITMVYISFKTKENIQSSLSGIGTGLITSLIVSVVLNIEGDYRKKTYCNENKSIVFKRLIRAAISNYCDIIKRINLFVIYWDSDINPIWNLYDNFNQKYTRFEIELKSIDYYILDDAKKTLLNDLMKFSSVNLEHLSSELNKINKESWLLQGFISESEYNSLPSAFVVEKIRSRIEKLSNYYNDEKIVDYCECVLTMRQILYLCIHIINAFDFCIPDVAENESAIKEYVDRRYYDIYSVSDEYIENMVNQEIAKWEYYAEHPEELEELENEFNKTDEEVVLDKLYCSICGFDTDDITSYLKELSQTSENVIDFFKKPEVKYEIKKHRVYRKAIIEVWGKEFVKKYCK